MKIIAGIGKAERAVRVLRAKSTPPTGTIKNLCAAVDQIAGGLAEVVDLRERNTVLEPVAADWNELCAGIRERFGVDVSSRDGQRWTWRVGKEEGSSTSLPRAILAALAAAGAKRAPPPPLDQQLLAAGAEQLPGFAAEQLRRHEGGG